MVTLGCAATAQSIGAERSEALCDSTACVDIFVASSYFKVLLKVNCSSLVVGVVLVILAAVVGSRWSAVVGQVALTCVAGAMSLTFRL